MQEVRVRFAPSPTGHLHIGGARVAIFNWLFARHHNGKYIVRIEDTDVERSKKEYVDSIIESLSWLNLESDEDLIFQSARTDLYKKSIKYLLENGLAYRCFCEPKSADEKIKELEKGVGTKYSGTCRDKVVTQEDLHKPHAIRFKIPKDLRRVSFRDEIRRKITVDVDQLDDFVIWRRDDMPTYNFCVVIDDSDMKITHVIRGEDHISNTPKQILLYQALEKDLPKFAHLPLILGSQGQKLSKRDAAVSVVEYKNQGFLADALFNYLVRLGWSHGDQEVFSRDEMIEFFNLDKVGKKGGIFDTKKLLWLNGLYIRELTYERFLSAFSIYNNYKLSELTALCKDDTLGHLFELYRERATTIEELVNGILSFVKAPEALDISLIEKWLTPQTKALVQAFFDRGQEVEEYRHENLLLLAKNICNEHEAKLVALAQPLRLALTGGTRSPGVFELLETLGKEQSSKRLESLLSQL